jgi:hypothetical protein
MGLAAISLWRMAVPARRGLGLEPFWIVRRGRNRTLEAGNGRVDAVCRRSGWNRAITSAGRERQDSAEPGSRTFRGDAARRFEYLAAGKQRSLESAKEPCARRHAKPIGGGGSAGPRRADDGSGRDGWCASPDRQWLRDCVRPDGAAICERGKSAIGSKVGYSRSSRSAGAKPLWQRDQPGASGLGAPKRPRGTARRRRSQRAKCGTSEGCSSASKRAAFGKHAASV